MQIFVYNLKNESFVISKKIKMSLVICHHQRSGREGVEMDCRPTNPSTLPKTFKRAVDPNW